jgi:hypothetical protein
MVSFSRRDLSKPSWVEDLEESGCISPTAPDGVLVMMKDGKGDKEGDERSAVVVMLSLALSMVDLEESGVIFSETRSEKGLRRESDIVLVDISIHPQNPNSLVSYFE